MCKVLRWNVEDLLYRLFMWPVLDTASQYIPPVGPIAQRQQDGKPTVCIIYSSDFKEHTQAVQCLANFLAKREIHILFNLWEEEAAANQFKWMTEAVSKANKVYCLHGNYCLR